MKRLSGSSWIALAAAASLVGCVGEVPDTGPSGPVIEQVKGLDDLFEDAAIEFNVPVELLKAIGYTETQWQMLAGHEEFDGLPAAYGIMALRGDRLARGAELAGVTEDEARTAERANIRAAAALLAEHGDVLGVERADLGAWAPAVAQFSGLPEGDGQSHYVVNDVYGAINSGVAIQIEGDGLLARIPATEVTPDFPGPSVIAAGGPVDYAGAVSRPSPNYSGRPAGAIGDVGMVIIHTCEGGYAGCWSWLQNSAAGASAHYVVSSTGSEITQLVREASKAWHIAANYACSNNSSVECWRNGYSSNNFTVGIEHAGYASQASWSSGLIEASAALTCDITRDHAIPRDRFHIVGHGQLQPWNRTDPGPNWPWTNYIARVKAICGDGGGTPPPPGAGEIVIDSNNANNDTTKGYVETSANWVASNSTSGYYGTGYWYANAAPVSDGATFWFYMPSAGSRTIDAWWTAGANRSASAPFVAFNAAGTKLGTAFENQQASGSQWVTLGTWSFSAGWNKVVLSRWTSAAGVVVADAVRVR